MNLYTLITDSQSLNINDPVIKGTLKSKFNIIIPAYNEEKRIAPVLIEVANFIESENLPWKVIVSIDGNDRTETIVSELSSRYPFLSGSKSPGRNGKGGAIKRSVSDDSDYTIFMDADNSVDFKKLITYVRYLESYDVIILSRYSNDANRIPLIRRFLSAGFNALAMALAGIDVRDKQSGYKIFRTEILMQAIGKVSVTNAFFDADLIFHLKRSGAKILEVPVEYNHGEGSTFNIFLLTVGMSVSLFAFTISHSRFNRFIPDSLRKLYYRKFRWI